MSKNPFEFLQNRDERTEAEGRRLRLRTGVLLGVFCCLLAVYLGVLGSTQLVKGDDYRDSAAVTAYRTEQVDAARGRITDREGNVLVGNALRYRITLDVSAMGSERNTVLARLLALCRAEEVEWADSFPVSRAEPWYYTRANVFSYQSEDADGNTETKNTLLGSLAKRLKWVSDPARSNTGAGALMTAMCKTFSLTPSGEDGTLTAEDRELLGVLYELYLRVYELTYSDYIFADDVDITLITRIKEAGLPGVTVESVSVRAYYSDCAPHVLGRVGAISSDEWPAYREQGYPMDAYVGKDGAELAFESWLHGSGGTLRTELDESGNPVSQTWKTEPQPGADVSLTLSESVQKTTEDLLAEFVATLEEPSGAAGVMVDMTGGVLALASYPDYDLATFSQNYTDLAADPGKPLLNRATMGLYAPGSTFKPLTAVAALTEGIITTASTVYCGGVYTYYPDARPTCWIYNMRGGIHGAETVSKAITDSCNIFFYDTGRRLGIRTLVDYATKFGLGQYTGIEIAEYKGTVAGPETSAALGSEWYAGNTMYAAIGQENNQFTPLQLANYIATLVNGGHHYQVHLMQEVRSAGDGSLLYTYEPVLKDTVDIPADALAAVKKGMYDLAQTSTMQQYFSSLPVSVGCKTGTAEVLGSSANAVFVCFAPYEDPQVAICLVAEKGASGQSLAGVAAGMLAEYFGVSTEESE